MKSSWNQFDRAVAVLAAHFATSDCSGVFGVPVGLCLAVALSHALERPRLLEFQLLMP